MYQKYGFELEGVSPVIFHQDDVLWADQVEAKREEIKRKQEDKFKAGDDRCPVDTWKGYLYNDGQFVTMPTDVLRSCIVKAGTRVTLTNRKSMKEMMAAAVVFDDLHAEFLTAQGRKISIAEVEKVDGAFGYHVAKVRDLGFDLLVKRATIGRAKHVRVRPVFAAGWSVRGTLTVVDAKVTFQKLEEIWSIGGLLIGICDWRPGSPKSPGPYGKFDAKLKKI